MEQPVISLRFYEDDIIKSYECFIIDDDTIRINVCHNSIEQEHVFLKEDKLKKLLNDEYFYIDGFNNETEINDLVKIKKSFIKSLQVLLQ